MRNQKNRYFAELLPIMKKKNTNLEIITNNSDLKASTAVALYRRLWDIETFFKQLKQNLNVKTFVGTSPNAVKS